MRGATIRLITTATHSGRSAAVAVALACGVREGVILAWRRGLILAAKRGTQGVWRQAQRRSQRTAAPLAILHEVRPTGRIQRVRVVVAIHASAAGGGVLALVATLGRRAGVNERIGAAGQIFLIKCGGGDGKESVLLLLLVIVASAIVRALQVAFSY